MYRLAQKQLEQLQVINDKYYLKIKNAYGRYVKEFNNIPDMTKNVFIIPDSDCINEFSDLAPGKNRGRCDAETGNIYIRESAFCEHLLVHEFMHRLSRNYDGVQWVNGIGIENDYYNLNGYNELLTEWLAFKITNIQELSNYQKSFFLIKHFYKWHYLAFKKMVCFYFRGNIDFAASLIFKYYGKVVNNQYLTTAIINYYNLSTDENLLFLKMFLCP